MSVAELEANAGAQAQPSAASPAAQTAAQLLEQHFDTAFAAPDGLSRLRELILTLAMQGKLTDQDSSDPPAAELLADIEREKRRLVAAGQIKAPKPLPPIEADEVPYEVPQGWEWVRLGTLEPQFQNGISKRSANSGEPFVVLRLADIKSSGISFDDTREILLDKEEIENYEIKEEDILITRVNGSTDLVGSFTMGEKYESRFAYCDHFIRMRFISNPVDLNFLQIISRGRLIRQQIESKFVTTAGQKTVNQGHISSLLLPLPPLPEQRRIVARIDQLMARCDELQALRTAQQHKRLHVHAAALSALLGAGGPDDFAEAWQFVAQHFDGLYSVLENVAELRRAVLQLAVMGKLVPQDPADPPARELLKDIEAEKNKIVKDGKLKSLDSADMSRLDDFPYEIPDSWVWCRFDDLAGIARGGSPRPIQAYMTDDPNGINWIKISDSERGNRYINSTRERITSEGLKKTRLVVPGDLILTNSMSYGYPYIMNVEGAIHDGWLLIRMPEKLIEKIYIYNALLSRYVKEFFSRAASGAVVQNLNADKVRQLPIPLPPLPEQRRIVARIDQLMALCGALEARLSAQASTQSALLDSLMDAVTPARPAPTLGPRPVRPAASAPANAAQPSPARGRGRPRKADGIPTADSMADAIQRLEALKLERAQGSRQPSLFDPENQ